MPDYPSYTEQLKDPRWQKKRLQIFKRDKWTCQSCFDTKSTLVVHHRYYINSLMAWEYPNEVLITLCEACHEFERETINESCDTLIQAVKSQFLSADIIELAYGISKLQQYHMTDVIASSYADAFMDTTTQMYIIDHYLNKLMKRKQGKVSNV